jgi:hypothetical protein
MGLPFGIPKRSSALCMCMALRIAAIMPITRLRPSSMGKNPTPSPFFRPYRCYRRIAFESHSVVGWVMQKTASETAFEQFCTERTVRWQPIPTEGPAGLKTPDYFIYPADERIAAEVKEIQPNAAEQDQERKFKETGWSTFGATVGDRARSIISTAAKQFRVKAKGQCPAIIVIYNPGLLLRHHTESHAIKAAMYGFDTIILGLSTDMREKPYVLDRKSGPRRKMTDRDNTTISAVAVLDSIGLTLYHNVFAALPLRSELFKGIAVRQFTLGEKRPGEFSEWQEVRNV